MQALQEYLETPLPPATYANINAALHLLRAYDPIITDPNRDFSICFYQGRQVAALRGDQETLGSYRDELAEFLGVDSNEVQVWQELVISPSCSTVIPTTNYPSHSHLSPTNLWIWT